MPPAADGLAVGLQQRAVSACLSNSHHFIIADEEQVVSLRSYDSHVQDTIPRKIPNLLWQFVHWWHAQHQPFTVRPLQLPNTRTCAGDDFYTRVQMTVQQVLHPMFSILSPWLCTNPTTRRTVCQHRLAAKQANCITIAKPRISEDAYEPPWTPHRGYSSFRVLRFDNRFGNMACAEQRSWR